MSNPVGGRDGPNRPPLSSNPQENPTGKSVTFVTNQVLSSIGGVSSLPASLSGRVSAGEVRPSKEDILKQWLESQPENAKAEAQQILSMLPKDLDSPFELDLRYLKNITSLPNVLQNCTELDCAFCTSLQTLPELSACKELDCSGCTSLQALPALTRCTALDCRGCTSLQALPELQVCEWLKCNGCENLKDILSQWLSYQPANEQKEALKIFSILRQKDLDSPFELDLTYLKNITSLPNVLQNCTSLNCIGCTSLQDLPDIPNCKELDCSGCTRLNRLPALLACKKLNCSGCTRLLSLPLTLPHCVELDCSGCTSLNQLPALLACTKLICIGCTSLRQLLALPHCVELDCSGCTSLQDFPDLTNCKELNCKGCTSLRALPYALPYCVELDCRGCTSLQTLPNALPACTELKCNHCHKLQKLPELLPVCTMLICIACESLQTLPELLPVCEELNCSGCTSLETLPLALSACRRLNCSGCTDLQTLPLELSVCEWLTCVNCFVLETLPLALPACTRLNCSGCEGLQALPLELPVCEWLECINCSVLQTLPLELLACTRLFCSGCESLRELPLELPVCEWLECINCTELQTLPRLPSRTRLDCRNCPLLPPQFQQLDQPVVRRSNLYQGRIDSAAQGTLQGALSFWSAEGKLPLPAATALELSEENQRLFQIFLNRLQETADFEQASPENKQDFALRVATIVRDMATSKEFCNAAIGVVLEAIDSCGDRLATGLNNLEMLSLMYGENKPKTDVDQAFLAIRILRLEQVREKAEKSHTQINLSGKKRIVGDLIETQLFVETQLREALKLPINARQMLYEGMSKIKQHQLPEILTEILALTATREKLIQTLAICPIWQDFLRSKNEAGYSELVDEVIKKNPQANPNEIKALVADAQSKKYEADTAEWLKVHESDLQAKLNSGA